MSMSQEEIEALMNESADLAPAVEDVSVAEEVAEETEMSQDDIAALVADVDADQPSQPEENLDEILAGIEGITEDEPAPATAPAPAAEPTPAPATEDVTAIMNEQINQGVYPLPVEREHKVVNQLSEVAEDSEEKASKIFDVLSFILDENNVIQQNSNEMNQFIEKQTALLESLSAKFPNVSVITENLALAREVSSASSIVTQKLNEENDQIFVAMDLMQFHDINRQKIERVMSVIRKLSVYLNGIFQDDSTKPEVQIARHISGDSAEAVTEDDIDSLIAEFSS